MSDILSNAWGWIKARLSEPSTWAGLAVAAMAVSNGLANGSDWGGLLGGVVAAVLKEGKSS